MLKKLLLADAGAHIDLDLLQQPILISTGASDDALSYFCVLTTVIEPERLLVKFKESSLIYGQVRMFGEIKVLAHFATGMSFNARLLQHHRGEHAADQLILQLEEPAPAKSPTPTTFLHT